MYDSSDLAYRLIVDARAEGETALLTGKGRASHLEDGSYLCTLLPVPGDADLNRPREGAYLVVDPSVVERVCVTKPGDARTELPWTLVWWVETFCMTPGTIVCAVNDPEMGMWCWVSPQGESPSLSVPATPEGCGSGQGPSATATPEEVAA